jgi:hypothetical protein
VVRFHSGPQTTKINHMKWKLNELLAKKKHQESIASAMTKDYIATFKRLGSSIFQGFRKTYLPVDDNPVDYNEIALQRVENTVHSKLDYYETNASPHFDYLMAVEATNAQAARADLIYDGVVVANLSTIELLALKSYLDRKEFADMYEHLPVRNETIEWKKSEDEEVKGEGIWSTNPIKGIDKTSEVTKYILEDPNIQFLVDKSKYVPIQAEKRVEKIKGHKESRLFSGEISHKERAVFLSNLSKLKEAIIEALERGNDVPVVESTFNSEKLFDILHRGKA